MTFVSRFLCLSLLTALMAGVVAPVRAQRRTPTPSPTVAPTETPTPTLTPVPRLTAAAVTLEQLRQKDQILRGPVDSVSFNLALPPEWQLTGNGALFLGLTTIYPEGAPLGVGRAPAVLHIGVNGVGLPDIVLDQPDYRQVIITIPDRALAGKQPHERHAISLQLNDLAQCAADQQISVIVSARSQLDLPHAESALVPDLRHLPWPLYQESVLSDTATVVLPDQPSVAELDAALLSMAGFARMTAGKLGMRLVPVGQMTQPQWADSHIIFVGKPAAFTMLQDVVLPNLSADRLGFTGIPANAGMIQLARSPWGRGRTVLFVSGQTDDAISKAARALSTGQVQPGELPNMAVVNDVQPAPRLVMPETFTLGDLGYDIQQFASTGQRSSSFGFDLPVDKAAKEGAYLEVSYVHSPLLDYAQSGFAVVLNGQTVGAVRFDDNSTQMATTRLSLPKTAIRPGRNELQINADLRNRDRCVLGSDLWATMRPETTLHLPLTEANAEPLPRRLLLNTFPRLFVASPTLAELAFVVPPDDPTSWAVAGRLAYDLGKRTSVDVIDLATAFANDVSAPMRAQRHLIVIGQPTQLPVLSDFAAAMPLAFAENSNVPNPPKTEVQYRLPSGSDIDIGFLEYMVAPDHDTRAVLMVLGNTPEGVQAAGDALLNPELRGKMTGNLSVVNGDKVDSSAVVAQIDAISPADPSGAGEMTATRVAAPAVTASAPDWLVPAVLGTFGGLLLLLLLSLTILRLRRRAERIEIDEG